MKILALLLMALAIAPASNKKTIYHKDWIDFNKNGVKDVYEDPKAPIDDRINDLLSQMTLEEKTNQMVTLYGYTWILMDAVPTEEWQTAFWKDGIGAIDQQYGKNRIPDPDKNPYASIPSVAADGLNQIQKWFIENTRLGIPVDLTTEGIHGVLYWTATDFPTQLALGHTWDKDLIRQVGYVTGREASAIGYTNVYAPILDVGRDQRWGRYEETYGEDPFLVAELGVQMTQGMQTNYQIASTAKHYCIYSPMKGAREGMSRVDPQVPPHEVENIHMYPWREVIRRGGLLGAMVSYNDYDGEPIEGSNYWLEQRMRGDFGFKGYLVSDSDAVEYLHLKHFTSSSMKESVRQSVLAGLNVRCTFRSPESYVLPIRELVNEGAIPMSVIDSRVADVLRVKFLVGLFDNPLKTEKEIKEADSIVNGAEDRAVALQACLESMVLLKNEGLLPLDENKIKTLAVIGPNADPAVRDARGYGPCGGTGISVLDGLRTRLPNTNILYAKGCEIVDSRWPDSEIIGYEPTEAELADIAAAVETARKADVAVLVLGGNGRTCGENFSRTSIDLPPCQELLLREVHKTGVPVALVLINGRPLSINWADRNVPAILEAWYPFTQGGTAIAQVLMGDYNPGGKLTVTFPKTVGQIPFNFPCKPNSQIDGKIGVGPDGKQSRIGGALYYFGHGLSYTTFEYSNLKFSSKEINPDGTVQISCDITNTGKRDGDEVVQLYLHDIESSITRYEKILRGFERVNITAGETKTVTFTLGPEAFEFPDKDMKYIIEPGWFDVLIGASSVDIRLEGKVLIKDPANPNRTYRSGMTENLPATNSAGGFVTFKFNPTQYFNSLDLKWSADSDCEYSVDINIGGGFFESVGKATTKGGSYHFQLKDQVQTSECRVMVTKGHGTLEDIRCEAL